MAILVILCSNMRNLKLDKGLFGEVDRFQNWHRVLSSCIVMRAKRFCTDNLLDVCSIPNSYCKKFQS